MKTANLNSRNAQDKKKCPVLFLSRNGVGLQCILIFLSVFFCAFATQAQQTKSAPRTALTRVADGFDYPVGKPEGEGYYVQRGYSPGRHMGEDWNGNGGGNTDLGDPVFSIGHGLCVMARNAGGAWGNLVIIRHVFVEKGRLLRCDSVYAHLDKIHTREGKQVKRGDKVGTIGTAFGRFAAHLHFEMRTEAGLGIGFNQRGFPKGYSHYYSPRDFIGARRKLPGAGRAAHIPIYTFPMPKKSVPANTKMPLNTGKRAVPSYRINRFSE